MTFLDDELSIITGPYEDSLSIDDVIDQDLILFVSLNVNKNTEPVRALGKMLLQNLQLVVGKRYERVAPSDAIPGKQDWETRGPIFSVILDEFAPFGYQNFAHILNTARFYTQMAKDLMASRHHARMKMAFAPGIIAKVHQSFAHTLLVAAIIVLLILARGRRI